MIVRRVFLSVAIFLASPPLRLAAYEPSARISYDETELRLLLTERNLDAAEKQIGAVLTKQHTQSRNAIEKRYEALRVPLETETAKQRRVAEARLESFVSNHADSPQVSEALLRLAVLQMESADQHYAEQMNRYLALPDETEKRQPRKNYGTALATLERLLAGKGGADNRAIAWYLKGYALQEMGEERRAVLAFEELLAESAESRLRAEILVRIGDYHFDRHRIASAARFYEAALAEEGPWMDRAIYKLAWSLYRQNAYAEAISTFTRLADMGRERPDLLNEAMQYLAISYVEGMGLSQALEDMENRGQRSYDDRLLRRIADIFYESTDFMSAVSAYTVAQARWPEAPENLRAAGRKVQSLHQMREKVTAVNERRRLATQFLPGSAWYAANATRATLREKADALVERYLFEYSTFHHEQWGDGNDASRKPAEEGYRLYLAHFPEHARAGQINFYLAELLYDRKAYADALSHYTLVARTAPDPTTGIAHTAAYNSVLAARRLYEQNPTNIDRLVEVSRQYADLLPTDENTPRVLYHAGHELCRQGLEDACRGSLSAMIESYPYSPLVLDAIRTVIDSYAKEERYGDLADWADRLLERGLPADKVARRYVLDMVGGAMFREAHAKDRLGDAEEAATRYLAVYRRYPATPAGVAALFNAAYNYEKAGHTIKALDLYASILERHGKEKFASRAAFRRGHILQNALDHRRAIAAYALVVEKYPRSEEAADALFNVASLSGLIGEHRQAARFFEQHWNNYGRSATEASDTLLRAAVQWEAAGETAQAVERYKSFAASRSDDKKAPFAAYSAAMLVKGGEQKRLLQQAVALENRLRDQGEPDLWTAGAARFALAELERERYRAIVLPRNMDRLASILENKATRLKNLQASYTRVVEAGHPHWAVAALFRIGEAYAHFAESLFSAPTPDGLSSEEAEIYKFELEEKALPVEDKAFEAWNLALERAGDLKMENEWTGRIRAALSTQPSRVRLLTDGLSPHLLAAKDKGHEPVPMIAAVRTSSEEVAADGLDGNMVGTKRLRGLLGKVLREQHTFFHDDDLVFRTAEGREALQ